MNKVIFRRGRVAVIVAILVIAVWLVADWRDWIAWPDALSYECSKIDDYCIAGEAPVCFVPNDESPSILARESLYVRCHWLSKEHCELYAHELLYERREFTCVPNPLYRK